MARKDIKFPSISRIINDRDMSFLIVGTTFIIASIIFLGLDLKLSYVQYKSELKRREELLDQESFWQDKLIKYPDFRDAYLSLAKVDYELGDKDSAEVNVRKAIAIDPNYEISINFQKILQGN